MAETNQRQRVIKALKSLDAMAVENKAPTGAGTPDVNYIEGWIELKWLRRWPKRSESIVKIEHFTLGQRRWLRDRYNAGGSAWLLLQVQQEWLLFDGLTAHNEVGKTTREGLYLFAKMRWTRGLKDKELKECLTRDWDNWNGLPVASGS